jgi:hypothetical protein
MSPSLARCAQVANDVAIGIEQTYLWHRHVRKVALTARFSKQILDLEL